MAELSKKKQNPHKDAAIQLFAFNHGISIKEVADKIGVSYKAVKTWREDPEFHLAIYNHYMNEFDSKLPSVLDAMVREAQEGNVQAGRLVLEHSGKLIKNIVNVNISPYEMFLNKVGDGEVVDDEVVEAATDVEFEEVDLPRRNMGKGWANTDVGAPISTKPLKQTGSLYESLEYNKELEIIDMNHYGIYHDKGHKYRNGVTIPARPFMIYQREANEALTKRNFDKELEKAFKKGG